MREIRRINNPLGELSIEFQCDVHDNTGQHCPELPIHKVNHDGKKVKLCDKCYNQWKIGAFSNEKTKTKNMG